MYGANIPFNAATRSIFPKRQLKAEINYVLPWNSNEIVTFSIDIKYIVIKSV